MVVDHADLETQEHFPVRKGQQARVVRVIESQRRTRARIRQRCARRGHEIRRRRAGGAAFADDRDRRVGAVFCHRVIRRRELERARARERATVQPREVLERNVVERSETAANHDLLDAIARLEQDRGNEAVRAETEVDLRINRTIDVQPRQPAARHPRAPAEVTRQHNLSIRLQRDRVHRVVHAARNRRGERRVERTVRIQARHVVVRHTVVTGEQTAEQNLAVRLEFDRAHRTVRARTRHVERRVPAAVHVQARDAESISLAIDVREITADENLPVLLHRDGIDRPIRPGAGIERAIHRAVVVEPRQEVLRRAIE